MKKVKKVYRLKMKAKIILAFIIMCVIVAVCILIGGLNGQLDTKQVKHKEIVKKEEKPVEKEINNKLESVEENQEEQIVEQPLYQETYTTRMTSFWENDGYGTGECTGSGLCSWNFETNENGWYVYNGKLVIATATTYLANQGWYVGENVHLYKYWEELNLVIDGNEYEAIILDSCGNCMKTDRVDLFVSNGSSARDTMIDVRRK